MNEVVVVEQSPENAAMAAQAQILINSGAFPDTKTLELAMAKCAIGKSIGFDEAASMINIHFYNGKPIIGYGLLATAIKRSPKYDYRVKEIGPASCTLDFYEMVDGERTAIGTYTYTMEDAQRAGNSGKDPYRKHPHNMLFARCLSNGYKFFCPDAIGTTVYVNEERDLLPPPEAEVVEPEPIPLIDREAAERLAQLAKDSTLSDERIETLCHAYGLPEAPELVDRLAGLNVEAAALFAGEIGATLFEDEAPEEAVEGEVVEEVTSA